MARLTGWFRSSWWLVQLGLVVASFVLGLTGHNWAWALMLPWTVTVFFERSWPRFAKRSANPSS
jgi:hypothetical protein